MDESDDEGFDENVNLYVTIGFTIKRLKRCTQQGSKFKYKWMKVDSLGDQALFVGDSSSLSLTASSLSGIKPSCIYFTTRFDSIDDLPLFHCTHNGGGFDMACLAWKVPQLSHFTSANSFRSFVPHLGYI